MSDSSSTTRVHPRRAVLGGVVLLGTWMVLVAPSACGVTAQDPSASLSEHSADLRIGVAEPAEPLPTEPLPAGDGGVPWRGECTADSDCDQSAAAALCGEDTEMYCKFFKRKDGGPADKGTCECRVKTATPTPIDAGVIVIMD